MPWEGFLASITFRICPPERYHCPVFTQSFHISWCTIEMGTFELLFQSLANEGSKFRARGVHIVILIYIRVFPRAKLVLPHVLSFDKSPQIIVLCYTVHLSTIEQLVRLPSILSWPYLTMAWATCVVLLKKGSIKFPAVLYNRSHWDYHPLR